MRKNDILTLRCENLGADMEGVCRVDGMAVFVPGLLPGEEARVRIVKTQPRFAFGRVEQRLSDADTRRNPDCAAYPRCGGCTCRHMSYETTLEAKRRQVADCFQRIGHLKVDVPPVLGMEHPAGYRNKTALPLGGSAENPQIGFYAPRSHALVPIAHCPNAMPPSDNLCKALLDWMRRFAVPPYEEATGKGLVRHLVVRVSRGGEAMAVVVANAGRLPHEAELCDALEAVGASSVCLNENRARTNVILGERFRTLRGQGVMRDTLCGLTFTVGPASFFQVNPVQTERLYQTAVDFAGLSPTDLVCDVYCGAGTMTLLMARHCRAALGIEVVPQAIDNARENAVRNGIANVDFRVGAAETVLPALVSEGLRPDVIVVDPPRKGLDEAVIAAIAAAAPRRVVYVSCNVATQARDAARLCAQGYEITRVQPVDMFCWTSGVETVMSLSQQKPDDTVCIGVDMDNMEVTRAESKATYAELQAYIEEKYGFKVSNLYIAQAKDAMGIKERENYNKPKGTKGRTLVCPPEKLAAIQEALRHFQMI